MKPLPELRRAFTFALVTTGLSFVLYSAQHVGAQAAPKPALPTDWPVYGGQLAGDHYSALAQINRQNVSRLKVAWTFDTQEKDGLQTSPLIVGHVLYGLTPSQKVIALDAATGKLLWTFDSGITGTQPERGLSWWTDGAESRLFAGVMNFLFALDPATGKPIAGFGENGRVDLRKGLRGDYLQQSIALTSPGIVYKDLIIVGGREPETHPAPPGDVRAFDVHTGALRWVFHTIPRPGDFGYETWPKDAWQAAGAANNWAGMALDAQRGIVYVPTGSAVSDFYGADRVGDDLFANTLLALDAETGKRLWYFQDVHHDIWDRDFPSPPSLLTVMHGGKRVDAVAQTTKQGYLYLFDRVTGQPLFPIKEEAYPASTVAGEVTSATQPKPLLPEPFARQRLSEDMLTTRTAEAHKFALDQFKDFRSDGQFVPFSATRQTVVFPGFDGGAEWGGSAVDTATGVIYVNANDIAWTGGLTVNRGEGSSGEKTYDYLCISCHGEHREGSPPAFPSLIGVTARLSDNQIGDTVHAGKGRMPAFPMLDDADIQDLLKFLKTDASGAGRGAGSDKREMMDKREMTAVTAAKATESQGDNAKYRFTGYRKFLDPDGYPAIVPPWGTLNAIDLNTGKYLWKIPLGEYPALVAQGLKDTGSENYGGPIVTAGGVVFIGATIFDRKMRAFDSLTGKLLWEITLPYAALATPATYMVDGKQYVVIAIGGGRDHHSPSGGEYVAFALP